MKTHEYLCPSCKGHLNVDDKIIFAVRNSRKQQGLLLLHPELGVYEAKFHKEFIFKDGENIEFHCPICNTNLTSEKNSNLAKLVMVANKETYEIYFSKVAGEKCTYQILGEHTNIYGEDQHKYINFFNLSQIL